PMPAPLEDIAVHIVYSPGIGGVTADLCGATEGWSRLSAIVRFAFEVRLLAAEFVAERRGRRRPGAARVFPLRLSGEPELPIRRELAGLAPKFGELRAERFGFGKVDIANRILVTR